MTTQLLIFLTVLVICLTIIICNIFGKPRNATIKRKIDLKKLLPNDTTLSSYDDVYLIVNTDNSLELKTVMLDNDEDYGLV